MSPSVASVLEKIVRCPVALSTAKTAALLNEEPTKTLLLLSSTNRPLGAPKGFSPSGESLSESKERRPVLKFNSARLSPIFDVIKARSGFWGSSAILNGDQSSGCSSSG